MTGLLYMRRHRVLLTALAALWAIPASVHAEAGEPAIEPIAHLAALARAAASRETGRPESQLEVASIDPRLRLPVCTDTPTGRIAPGTQATARVTIEVRCAAPAWRQFVAVRIHAEEPVVVAARPLGRLDVVQAEDVMLVPRDLGALPGGFFRQTADVVGRIAQRTIGAGEVLLPTTVRPPSLVRRGQTVTLLVRAGGLSVRSSGVALGDAGLAERVQVRNSSSAKQVEGIVRSADMVEVSLE